MEDRERECDREKEKEGASSARWSVPGKRDKVLKDSFLKAEEN